MNSKALISPVLAFAALMVAAPATSAPQSPVAAERYEFSFPANSDKFPALATNSPELAVAIDLLVHQGNRRELRFVMTGAVSKACMEWPSCPERTLLMHRVEHIADALRASWPAGVEKGVLERMRWEAIPSSSSGHDPDRVQILLRIRSTPRQNNCPARLELLDPNLPGTVDDPGRAHWIEMPDGEPLAVSSSARLRASQTSQGPQSIEVWLNAGGQSKQLRLDQEFDEKVFASASESSFSITLKVSGDTSTTVRELVQREGIQSRMGEIVTGFPATTPGNTPSVHCSFGFHRWNR